MIALFLFRITLFTISMFFLVEYVFLSPIDTQLGALLIFLITAFIVLFFTAARSYPIEECSQCHTTLSRNPLRLISAF